MQKINNIVKKAALVLFAAFLATACIFEKMERPGNLQSVLIQINVSAEQMRDWARMMDIEFVHITKDSTPEKLEEELNKMFNARIIRMDMDTTSKKGMHEKIINDFGELKYEIENNSDIKFISQTDTGIQKTLVYTNSFSFVDVTGSTTALDCFYGTATKQSNLLSLFNRQNSIVFQEHNAIRSSGSRNRSIPHLAVRYALTCCATVSSVNACHHCSSHSISKSLNARMLFSNFLCPFTSRKTGTWFSNPACQDQKNEV